MKYYLEVQSDEHMLNVHEIACKYGIRSTKDKPHARFVARLLTEYLNRLNIEEKYYYKTSKGDMMRVYPSTMYGPLFRKLREDYPHNAEIVMEFDNKNHHFMIKGDVLENV